MLKSSLSRVQYSQVRSPLSCAQVDRAGQISLAELWSKVDADTTLLLPAMTPIVNVSNSETFVKQMLLVLKFAMDQNPAITSSTLKAIVEKMTEILTLMGCPLVDWSRRVTLLLKFVKRREFLANELPSRLATLEMRQTQCISALHPLQKKADNLCTAFDASEKKLAAMRDKAAKLRAKLAAVEARVRELATIKAQQTEAVSLAERELSSITTELEALQVQKKNLEAMSSFPLAGLTSLEAILEGP